VTEQFKAKSFMSGNSVAMRLPKGLGVDPGLDWTVEWRGNDLVFQVKDRPKRKFNIEKVWGSAKGLQLIKPEDRVFEPSRRVWDDPDFMRFSDDDAK